MFFFLPGRDPVDQENLLNLLSNMDQVQSAAARRDFDPFEMVGLMADTGLKCLQKGSLFAEDASCDTPHGVATFWCRTFHSITLHSPPHVLADIIRNGYPERCLPDAVYVTLMALASFLDCKDSCKIKYPEAYKAAEIKFFDICVQSR